MSTSLNVIYLLSEEVGLEDKALSGRLSLERGSLTVRGDAGVSLELASVRDVELVRLHLGHCVRVRHEDGTLWLAAYWVNLWGWLVILRSGATRLLARRLESLVSGPPASET